MSAYATFVSPNGVEHAVVRGRCVTCGRNDHIDYGHLRTAQRFDLGSCRVERIDWPYECVAKDKNPDAKVFACLAHGAWWYRNECEHASYTVELDGSAECLDCGAQSSGAQR